MWARLVAGWAHHLDDSGARFLCDGVFSAADAGGSYEGVLRMLWGLGGWLSRPERPAGLTWRNERFDLLALSRRAIVNGCDPTASASWLRPLGAAPRPYDQRTVESGQLGFVLWQTRERLWDTLSDAEREHIFAFLDRFGQRPSRWHNNWALFWVLNHTSRKMLGLPYDPDIIEEVLGCYLDGVYCGDGWYDDAATCGANSFDDYNTWVFASHVLAWAQMDGGHNPLLRDRLLARVRAWMTNFPYFFAADGAYSEFGRSLSYKFARLGAPLWAYKLGVWPYSAGMLRRLVGRHLRWYFNRGAVRADGTLHQSLTACGSLDIREVYISTGAPYWAMQAFGGMWSLADDDPLWTTPEEPLPAEQGDFVKVFPQPGWVVTATGGEIQRFNAGSFKSGYGSKYNRLHYATHYPFQVGPAHGQPTPDGGVCLMVDGIVAARTQNDEFAVGEPGWLRMRYDIQLGKYLHKVETVIVIRGAHHLRAHRIKLDAYEERRVELLEGGAPLGFHPGELPSCTVSAHEASAGVAKLKSTIRSLHGYDSAEFWPCYPHSNSVHAHALLPTLRVHCLARVKELACMVTVGLADPPQRVLAVWQDDQSLRVIWDEVELVIPPLG